MPKPAAAVVGLVCLGMLGGVGLLWPARRLNPTVPAPW